MYGQIQSCEGLDSVTAGVGEPSLTIGYPSGDKPLEEEDPSSRVLTLTEESEDVVEDVGEELSCFLVNLNCQEERGGEEVLPYAAVFSSKEKAEAEECRVSLDHKGAGQAGKPSKRNLSDGVDVDLKDGKEGVETSTTSSRSPRDASPQTAKSSDGDTMDSIKTFALGGRGPSAAIGCRATVYIGNIAVDTVVDTGAHRTLLSEAVYQRLRGENCPEVGVSRPTGMVLRSASGDDCRVSGVSSVSFTLNGEGYRHPMYITEMGDVELLLGMDFLFSNQAVIDLKARILSLPGHDVPLRTQDLKSPLAARVKRAIEIEGGTQCFVQCEVLGDTELTAFDSYFEPAVALGPGAYLEPSLIHVQGASAGIVVSNYSAESVALDEGQILGMLSEPAKGATVGGVFAVHLWDGRNGTYRFRPEGVSKRRSTAPRSLCSTVRIPPENKRPLHPPLQAADGTSVIPQPVTKRPPSADPEEKKEGKGSPPCPEHLLCTLPDSSEVSLTASQLSDAHRFLKEFEGAFTTPDGDVGQTDVVEHEIRLSDETPFKLPVRRLGPSQREVVQTEVQKVIDAGKVVPSSSPYASPVVLVRKKDGTLRLCIDYRRLNELTIKDAFPLPRIDDSLDSLGGAKWFCTLDLASGYWQIRMAAKDRHKTAFVTHMGLYEWLVMPFGLANAPATFGRMMAQILGDITYTKCLVYLDDVIVFGATWPEILQNLRDVFVRLEKAGLRLKPTKCFLFRERVQYLGHIVSSKGVSPDPNKVAAVLDWHVPSTLKELRAFLGLAGYYRRFVEDFSRLADPLYELTKKGQPFTWSPRQQASFEQLKKALTSPPVLSYPTREGLFVLDTDASNVSIGAVLSQVQGGEERVIAYASKRLSDVERRYCTTKRELFAVIYAVRWFRSYLIGRHFVIRTDHSALRWLKSYREGDDTMTRWNYMLDEYDFDIIHRKGAKHCNADALSRSTRLCPRWDCEDCSPKRTQTQRSLLEKRVHADLEAAVVTRNRSRRHEGLPVKPTVGSEKGEIPSKSLQPEPCEASTALSGTGQSTVLPPEGRQPAGREVVDPGLDRKRRGVCSFQSTQGRSFTHSEGGASSGKSVQTRQLRSGYNDSSSSSVCPRQEGGEGQVPTKRRKDQGRRLPRIPNQGHEEGVKEKDSEVGSESAATAAPEGSAREDRRQGLRPRPRNVDHGPAIDFSGVRSKRKDAAVGRERKGVTEKLLEKEQGRSAPDSTPPHRLVAEAPEERLEGPLSDTSLLDIESAPPKPCGEKEEEASCSGTWYASLTLDEWRAAQHSDPVIQRVIHLMTTLGSSEFGKKIRLLADEPPVDVYQRWADDLVVLDGILFKCDQVEGGGEVLVRVVPRAWRVNLSEAAHTSPIGGHMSRDRLYNLLRRNFWWPGMRADISKSVAACESCARQKPGVKANKMRLKQNVPGKPFDRVACDVMGPFHLTERGSRYLVVIQDYFSKWVECYPVPNHTAAEVANCLKQWCLQLGCPVVLHTDQGREFEGHLYRELCRLLGVLKTRTTAYAPWSDGLVERYNRTIKTAIQHYTTQKPSHWDLYVGLLAAAYRCMKHESTGYSPNFLVYGREVTHPLELFYGRVCVSDEDDTPQVSGIDYVRELQGELESAWHTAWLHLYKAAQKQQEQRAKQGLRERLFSIGDEVLVKSPRGRVFKHGDLWIGPCTVEGVVNDHVVKVQTPVGMRTVNTNNCKPHTPLRTDEMAP